jgi:hypothetical protein
MAVAMAALIWAVRASISGEGCADAGVCRGLAVVAAALAMQMAAITGKYKYLIVILNP